MRHTLVGLIALALAACSGNSATDNLELIQVMTYGNSVSNAFTNAGATPDRHCFQLAKDKSSGARLVLLVVLEPSESCPAQLAPQGKIRGQLAVQDASDVGATHGVYLGGQQVGNITVSEDHVGALCSNGAYGNYTSRCSFQVDSDVVAKINVP